MYGADARYRWCSPKVETTYASYSLGERNAIKFSRGHSVQTKFSPSRSGRPNMSRWIQSFEVPSTSGRGTYTVSLDKQGHFGCSCPQWKFRRVECKHIARIKEDVQCGPRALARVVQLAYQRMFRKSDSETPKPSSFRSSHRETATSGDGCGRSVTPRLELQ